MASQKSVLITGTSAGGIGSYLAFEFQRRGLLVFATARNLQKVDPALSSLPNIELVTLDVTSPSSIAAAVEVVSAKTGGTLDILVNNSGSGYTMPLLDSSLDTGRQMFEANFWGLLAVTKAFAPLVITAKGTIANNSSISGETQTPWDGVLDL